MHKTFAIIASVLAAGCALDEPAPHVRIVVPAGADMLPGYVEGANAWGLLGFDASFESNGAPACPRGWHSMSPPVVDCEITIGIERFAWLKEKTGADGLTDTTTEPATVMIDSRWDSWALLAIAAHETGHVLLDTGKHAPAGSDAIMAPSGAQWFAQPLDYALACESIGRGCDRR